MSFAASRMTTRYSSSGMEGSSPAANAMAGNRRTAARSKNLADDIFLDMRSLLDFDPARRRSIPPGGEESLPGYDMLLP